MKTSELQGAALDWAVHIAQGLSEEDFVIVDSLYGPQWRGPEYSTSWQEGGPIIERERIDVLGMVNGEKGPWTACVRKWDAPQPWRHIAEGPTPLVAAMRCYVTSKLGNDVNVPEVL